MATINLRSVADHLIRRLRLSSGIYNCYRCASPTCKVCWLETMRKPIFSRAGFITLSSQLSRSLNKTQFKGSALVSIHLCLWRGASWALGFWLEEFMWQSGWQGVWNRASLAVVFFFSLLGLFCQVDTHWPAGFLFLFLIAVFPFPLLGRLLVTPRACLETGFSFSGSDRDFFLKQDFTWSSTRFTDNLMFLSEFWGSRCPGFITRIPQFPSHIPDCPQ